MNNGTRLTLRANQRLGMRCALLGALTLLAACSSINPWAKSDKGPKPLELPALAASAQTLKSVWRAGVGKSDPYILTPAVVGSVVYAASADGDLSRIENGKETRFASVGQTISGGVGTDGKVLAVGTPKGEVMAYSTATGKLLWKVATGAETLAAPAVDADLVIVRGGDSRIQAFDAVTGKRRWIYQRSTPALTLRSNVGITLLPNAVAAGFPGGKLVLIARENGAQMWEATVAQSKGSTELERVADITSSPVVVGDKICAVAYQGRVACFSTSNGSQVWARDVSSIAGLDADDKAVYVSAEKGAVIAFDAGNGFNMWEQGKLANRVLSRPLAIGELVLVGDNLGMVHALNRQSGAFVARVTVDSSRIAAEPQRMGRAVVVQTISGAVHALSTE